MDMEYKKHVHATCSNTQMNMKDTKYVDDIWYMFKHENEHVR